MRITVIINNLKHDDCRNTIASALKNFIGITNFEIDVDSRSLTFDCVSHNTMEGLRFYLAKIGYPIIKEMNVIS